MVENEEIKSLLQEGDIYTDKTNDELVYNPFNPKNIEISENIIQSILRKYGINSKIHNLNLYKRAFIHKSYVKRPFLENEKNNIKIVEKPFDCLPLKTKSNERLKLLLLCFQILWNIFFIFFNIYFNIGFVLFIFQALFLINFKNFQKLFFISSFLFST